METFSIDRPPQWEPTTDKGRVLLLASRAGLARFLRQLREMAEEIGHGHMDYAERFHRVLQSLKNPNLPDVADGLQYTVRSYERGTRQLTRVIAACGNPTVARAAYECACKLFANERWTLRWGGYQMDESERLPLGD